MNVNDMREKLYEYCRDADGCIGCKLEDNGHCRLHKMGDEEIIEAYEIVFGDEENKSYIDELKSENVIRHEDICKELNELYIRKNKDYGDSYHLSFLEEGMAMARIRLGDKLNRFKTLTKSELRMVTDESIRDTLIDLANYSIMTVMEIDRERESYESE